MGSMGFCVFKLIISEKWEEFVISKWWQTIIACLTLTRLKNASEGGQGEDFLQILSEIGIVPVWSWGQEEGTSAQQGDKVMEREWCPDHEGSVE